MTENEIFTATKKLITSKCVRLETDVINIQAFVHGGMEVKYLSKGKTHAHLFKEISDLVDWLRK